MPAQPEPELQRLRHENERLRAEVAFLGKVEALSWLSRPSIGWKFFWT